MQLNDFAHLLLDLSFLPRQILPIIYILDFATINFSIYKELTTLVKTELLLHVSKRALPNEEFEMVGVVGRGILLKLLLCYPKMGKKFQLRS